MAISETAFSLLSEPATDKTLARAMPYLPIRTASISTRSPSFAPLRNSGSTVSVGLLRSTGSTRNSPLVQFMEHAQHRAKALVELLDDACDIALAVRVAEKFGQYPVANAQWQPCLSRLGMAMDITGGGPLVSSHSAGRAIRPPSLSRENTSSAETGGSPPGAISREPSLRSDAFCSKLAQHGFEDDPVIALDAEGFGDIALGGFARIIAQPFQQRFAVWQFAMARAGLVLRGYRNRPCRLESAAP